MGDCPCATPYEYKESCAMTLITCGISIHVDMTGSSYHMQWTPTKSYQDNVVLGDRDLHLTHLPYEHGTKRR